MPRIAIDLTDKMMAGLQAETDRYNAAQGTTFIIAQWVRLHLQEIVIAQQLDATVAALQEQAQRDANAALAGAVRAARDDLIAGLDR